MRITALTLLGLGLLSDVTHALPAYRVPRLFQRHGFTRSDLDVHTVQLELGPLLSPTATIYGPDNAEWEENTERFNTFTQNHVQVIVEPGEESDVSTIVKYSNDNSIDFFVYGRGHGQDIAIASFKGLQINLEPLDSIEISEDGESVFLQAGLDNGHVIRALWEEGLHVTTGTTACVGVFGAGLGGGHGLLEGQYGLVIDNAIHMNVVLADGTAIGVNATSHPDLWWAMRGAGHNFGIVTSAQLKVHGRTTDTWHWHNYWWTGDKLEAIFEAINALHTSYNGTTPPLMGMEAGALHINTTVSDEPSFLWTFGYGGPADEAEEILAPFNAIEAFSEDVGDAEFPDVANRMSNGYELAGCAPQAYSGTSTITGHYDIAIQRRIYDLFKQHAEEYPELAAATRVFNEGYATKGMSDVPADSTAYAHRDRIHIIYQLSANAESLGLLDVAQKWARDTWELWLENEGPGARPVTYPNYVLGQNPGETLQSIYGDEPWRLDRLRELKGKYDPYNRFRYYIPIIRPGNYTV